MAFAPELARTLARRPAALDALIDGDFFSPIDPAEAAASVDQAVRAAGAFEPALDAARRVHRDQVFRAGVQVLSAMATPEEAGAAFAALGDACIRALAPIARAETDRVGGALAGEVAVVALGKAGSQEMSAGSDLDLMTVYAAAPEAISDLKGWAADTYFARFTQRLVAALSAPTAEGGLYEVDMRLRPSGTAGPVAVKLAALEHYYAHEADTWEFLALSRARVVWASSPAFETACARAIEQALRQPRDAQKARSDIADMRALMLRERPPRGFWDLKLVPGGMVDVEFAAQTLQLLGASLGGRLNVSTVGAFEAAVGEGRLTPADAQVLTEAWRLNQSLTQLLKLALDDGADPDMEPLPFRMLMARHAGLAEFEDLKTRLAALRLTVQEICRRIFGVNSSPV